MASSKQPPGVQPGAAQPLAAVVAAATAVKRPASKSTRTASPDATGRMRMAQSTDKDNNCSY